MQATEEQSPTRAARADSMDIAAVVEASEQVLAENAASAEKVSPAGGGSGAPGTKPSKRYVDEDSKNPEYRSDTWRMANFKVRSRGFRSHLHTPLRPSATRRGQPTPNLPVSRDATILIAGTHLGGRKGPQSVCYHPTTLRRSDTPARTGPDFGR